MVGFSVSIYIVWSIPEEWNLLGGSHSQNQWLFFQHTMGVSIWEKYHYCTASNNTICSKKACWLVFCKRWRYITLCHNEHLWVVSTVEFEPILRCMDMQLLNSQVAEGCDWRGTIRNCHFTCTSGFCVGASTVSHLHRWCMSPTLRRIKLDTLCRWHVAL